VEGAVECTALTFGLDGLFRFSLPARVTLSCTSTQDFSLSLFPCRHDRKQYYHLVHMRMRYTHTRVANTSPPQHKQLRPPPPRNLQHTMNPGITLSVLILALTLPIATISLRTAATAFVYGCPAYFPACLPS